MTSMHNQPSLASDERMAPIASATTATPHTPWYARMLHRAILSMYAAPGGVKVLNRFVVRYAGSRHFTLFSVLTHQGRRSGRAYSIPVAARRTADGFVVPLTFGEQVDWYKNVLAAGGCVIRWKGVDYLEGDPEIIDWLTARTAFSPIERALLSTVGMAQFVRLRQRPPKSLVAPDEQ